MPARGLAATRTTSRGDVLNDPFRTSQVLNGSFKTFETRYSAGTRSRRFVMTRQPTASTIASTGIE
jgi:hypothetical protein